MTTKENQRTKEVLMLSLEITDFLIVVGACSAITSCTVIVTVYGILNGWKKEICNHITQINDKVTDLKIKLFVHLGIVEQNEL